MSEHTPIPWYVGEDYYGGVSIRTKPTQATNIIGEDAVFECTGRGSGEMSEEDAAFIVQCCNSHAVLLVELKSADAIMQQLCKIIRRYDKEVELPPLRIGSRKAAIELAGEKR